MNIPEQKLLDEIDRFKSDIEDLKNELEAEPDQRRASELHSYIAGDAQNIAVCHSLLRNLEETNNWYAIASKHCLRRREAYKRHAITEFNQSHWEDEPLDVLDALYYSLLSNDEETIQQAADAAQNIYSDYESEYPDVLYQYYLVKTIAAIINNESQEIQRDYIDKIRTHSESASEELQNYFNAFATTLQGIAEQDMGKFKQGIELTLEEHKKNISGEPEGPSEWIDYRSTALVILAQRNNIQVKITNEYIPDSII